MEARGSKSYQSLDMSGDNSEAQPERHSSRILKPCVLLVTCLVSVLLVFLVGTHRTPSWELLRPVGAGAGIGRKNSSSEAPNDRLLGGLLSPDFDGESCLSRYQSMLYRKASPHAPSPYLIRRLREYEALHKKCAPNTHLYNKSIEQLKSGRSNGPMECNYVVWIPHNGLGNRVLTIVSTFLYALLNNKVLLLHIPGDFTDLLCEPFPGTSWVLPSDFPVHNFLDFDKGTPQSYGNMLRNKVIDDEMLSGSSNATLPAYVYLHLPWYYDQWDKLFFCGDAQLMLRRIPWLLLKSDHYFVPSLFLLQEYEEELRQLFLERATTFHHLVRYLVHPTNVVWDYVTKYYRAHLAAADETLGIQIRVFHNFPVPFESMLRQVINCSLSEGILPAVNLQEWAAPASKTDMKVKAVLVASLFSGYAERIRDMYAEHPTTTGEVVRVHQPSHEEQQHTEQQGHNIKALAEVELLSFSDALITSAWSTFGYVAQGLGGLQPWILLRHTQSDLPCRQAMSSEPCYLMPPPYPSTHCSKDHGDAGETAAARQYVRQCEDELGGIKVFD
ncbi:unnamed protein product [Musa acuminata var. zebrina]